MHRERSYRISLPQEEIVIAQAQKEQKKQQILQLKNRISQLQNALDHVQSQSPLKTDPRISRYTTMISSLSQQLSELTESLQPPTPKSPSHRS